MSESIVMDNGKGKQKERESKKLKPPQARKVIPKQDEGGIGVSKVKAALRQTRRLLAKENLSANVRQEAERKMVALEDELNGKEQKAKERKYSQKYHKVRFFERQKLVRRINKLKKAQEEDDANIASDLYEARLLLNYVLHYPMSQKYVALFANEGDSTDKSKEALNERNTSKKRGDEVKARIKAAMEKGELSVEPEVDLESRTTEEGLKVMATKRKVEIEPTTNIARHKKKPKRKEVKSSNLEDDDFFD